MTSELARKTRIWYEARINLLHAEMELELEKLNPTAIDVTIHDKKLITVDAHEVRPHMRMIPVKTNRRKKDLDIEEIVRLRTLGHTQKEIGKMMGVSAPTISNRLKEYAESGFVETGIADVRPYDLSGPKARPKTYTPNVSQRVFEMVQLELLAGNEITAADCEAQLVGVSKKSIASAFSSISMCLTDLGGTTRRVKGRGGRVHLIPNDDDIIKNFTHYDLHKWKKERYNIE